MLEQLKNEIENGRRFFYTNQVKAVSLYWHLKKIKERTYYANYSEMIEKEVVDKTVIPYFEVHRPKNFHGIGYIEPPILLEYVNEGNGYFKSVLTGEKILLYSFSNYNDFKPESINLYFDKYTSNDKLPSINDTKWLLHVKDTYEALLKNPMVTSLADIKPLTSLTTDERLELQDKIDAKGIFKLLELDREKHLKKECLRSVNKSEEVYKEVVSLCNFEEKYNSVNEKKKIKSKA